MFDALRPRDAAEAGVAALAVAAFHAAMDDFARAALSSPQAAGTKSDAQPAHAGCLTPALHPHKLTCTEIKRHVLIQSRYLADT